ncbi:asparagine synthase (glutamine-hydrolyzing) [Terasakiella pusilla]|uniref:asparagine synthase (glutamine-hydrolyzing) n=1 Tax=Terasakiella pusilla TaxID=64973 RepID=UPI003AA82043
MCGIVGQYNVSIGQNIDAELLTRMRDTMVHRGPDGAGIWISEDQRVGFGHRRLSIIDLSEKASQPMLDPSGQVCLTFNGEIYNHVELRAELEKKGHAFKTSHSDTEVLLHAYLQWGIEAIQKFRGMFAFSIWDGRTRDFFLVRDRMGVKPLYWAQYDGKISFASEIKALLEDRDLNRELNTGKVADYLSFLALPAPNTLFKGIKKLGSGTYIHVNSSGKIREEKWWDPLIGSQKYASWDSDNIIECVREKIKEAVALRSIGDVPVGIFLSGGIDSSANAALFAQHSGHVKTFSIGYDQDYSSYTNELDYARKAADYIGAEHHELKLKKADLQSFLPDMVYYQDEPIADPVCIPLYYVSKLARDHGVTVCQVGEGADELFCGYPNWKRSIQRQKMLSRFDMKGVGAGMLAAGLNAAGKGHTQTYDHLMRASHGHPIFHGGAESFSHKRKTDILNEEMFAEKAIPSTWEGIEHLHDRFIANGGKGILKWMTYLDLNYRLPELLLMRVDKMSMAVGLEARVPFLDHEFVEMSLSIDERILTEGGNLKHVLKKAVRGLIPDEIIDRKKQGFGLPLEDWIVDDLEDQLFETICEFNNSTQILNGKFDRSVFSNMMASHKWTLGNLALWWKRMLCNTSVLSA